MADKDFMETIKRINESLVVLRGGQEEIKKGITSLKAEMYFVKRELSIHNDKIEALIIDTIQLQSEVGALGDKIDANVDTTKRQISEIREELGLAS